MAAALLNRTEEQAVARNTAKLYLRMKEYVMLEIYEKDFRRNSRTQSSTSVEKTSLDACPDTGKNSSTDLYVSTHLNDSPLSSNHLSALRKGLTDVPGIYTLPSKPALGLSHKLTAKMEKQSEYGDQKKTWRCEVAVQKMDALASGIK
ncbi:hypothetical protein XELAEV_18025018mg [Xenopus laevis]|uniref:Uncharacterized protein n=1 Tax=Xenopus laevis TaxID=8355 RepID=A0A974HLG0_XENLA|nr:hypothetical protein XELAEV_18025018mg [Xenopus laevis]